MAPSGKLKLLAALAGILVLAGLVAAGLALRSPTGAAPDPASDASAADLPLKVIVEQPGLTAISAADLQAAGIAPDSVLADRWQLRREDQPAPLLPWDQGDDLRLVFYAQASDNPYSRQQVYWLEAATAGGLRPETRPVVPAIGGPAMVVTDTFRLDWRTTYNSRLVEGADRWLGDALFGGRELSLPFVMPAVTGDAARLTLRLWANTSSPNADPDHHVQVWLNGQLIADGSQEGQGFWDLQATIPSGLLQSAENELRLVAPGDTGARAEQDYPDWLLIEYARPLDAGAGALEFAAPPGAFRVTGLANGAAPLLWDVSQPDRPVQLLFEPVAEVDEAGALAFADSTAGPAPRRYVLGQVENLPTPLAIVAPRPGDLRALQPASYVAIGPPDLLEAARSLLEHRQAAGLATLAVDVEAIYEQFAAGRRGPEAIRSFLRHAVEQWPEPPRFVLLVGDASYDPLGYSGDASADRLPTCLVDTHFVGETASDHCYADLDGDLAPELAVGRLPAQTPQQVAALVGKIIEFEGTAKDADWPRRALLVADADAEFSSASDELARTTLAPAGYAIEKLYLSDPDLAEPGAGRARLLEQLQAGVGLVNYAGHGSPRWWAGELLSNQDAKDLPNAGRWPIVTAMTCLTGYFHHPASESLSEALLWAEGGAIAAFMPSSEGITSEQLPLAEAFYRRLTGGDYGTLGEVVLATKQELVETGSSSDDMIRTFNLLGDPALRLP